MGLIRGLLCAAGIWAYAGCCYAGAAQGSQVRIIGHEFSYDEILPTGVAGIYEKYGQIIVKNASGIIVYKEIIPSIPGCLGVEALFAMDVWNGLRKVPVAVLCGSAYGRHNVLRVFRTGSAGLSVTSLDFYDSSPNLLVSEDGRKVFSVLSRNVALGANGYAQYFPFVYELRVDDSVITFVPVFEVATKHYIKFFRDLIDGNNDVAVIVGPAVAALIATEQKGTSCDGFKELIAIGVNLANIREWIVNLSTVGYPYFNMDSCGDYYGTAK